MRRIDPLERLLASGLDLSAPFTPQMADAAGVDRRHRSKLIADGLLLNPVRGVLHGSHLADSLELRLACLRLVVPVDAVITDRTAGWLHGASMILAPGDHLQPPLVSAFQPPGKRLRNELSASGERGLTDDEIVLLGGVRLTTPLRTACDLGRLLRRDAAWAALDSMLRLQTFTKERLIAEVERFRGYRGVRQLRTFAPLADAGSESFGESVLRLRWYDACLAQPPETQIEISSEGGRWARLDIGCRDRRYAAEYDGEDVHQERHAAHDINPRDSIADERRVLDVSPRHHVC